MPNWCMNELEIYAYDNEEQFNDFINKVRDTENGSELSLEKLLPTPLELLALKSPNTSSTPDECSELILKYGHTDWYEWRLENWGTKWDVDANLTSEGDSYRLYKFESAWTPPTKWIATVARMFPDVRFKLKYDEPGMCFMGVCLAHGENFYDDWIDYSFL